MENDPLMEEYKGLRPCVRCGRHPMLLRARDEHETFIGYTCYGCSGANDRLTFDQWSRANRSRLGRIAFVVAAWVARWLP